MIISTEAHRLRRILIVEDEPQRTSEDERTLREAGYEVVATVNRFRDATAIILQQVAVDLVVTDVNLAGVRSGVELARHARELGIAVLFATADLPDVQEKDSALGCITKPYQPQDLVRAIQVCERLVRGRAAGKLPLGFRLFQRAELVR